ncbi:MAG TPA: SLC13 family permease [Spirochaetota bacterium]|nr:SLC13 family permease [Spirochaetota bacterium]
MQTIALVIFIITYTGIIFTRLPWVNVDRPSAAFFGAVAMVLCGVITFDEAVRSIDANTIALLLGMMIVVATLELDGFFSLIARRTIALAKTRLRLLAAVTFVTGIASAFLVNDAVVLLFTPVVIAICRASRVDPIPYLIAEILASNVGSAMTITGNPQNMLIGINSGIPYARFLLCLLPISLLGLCIVVAVVRAVYRRHFAELGPIEYDENGFEYNYASMKFSVPIFALVIVLFFLSHLLHLSIPVIALVGASLVLIFGKIKPSTVIKSIDWVLLLFFASLFIVVHGVEAAGLMLHVHDVGTLRPDIAGLGIIHALSLALSQIVSNVPFTIVMLPLMKNAGSEALWLALASASTLAGNATIIGAMANLIVIESAQGLGVRIGFREFLRPGVIVTLATLALSMGVLALEVAFGVIR